jgi:hypothetical protein
VAWPDKWASVSLVSSLQLHFTVLSFCSTACLLPPHSNFRIGLEDCVSQNPVVCGITNIAHSTSFRFRFGGPAKRKAKRNLN